jgi:short-subunit dehydrogenase
MSDKLAVVTGASSGIGLSLANELAFRGYDLVVCSSGERLSAATETTRSFGTNIIEVKADLSTREGVDSLWSEVANLGRPVDVACINAGVGVGGEFWETDLDEELKMVGLNCAGTVQLAKYVVRQMRELNAGKILFTSSIAGEMVAPREAVYAATKAFVLSLAHSIRYELRDSGVTVTALQPGPTDTDFFHRAGMDNTQVGSEGKKQSQPEDVAKEGIEALFAGKSHVYSHSMTTKLEGFVANLVPGTVKASMHEKMAKPVDND